MRTAYYETKCSGLTVERRSRRSRTEAQRRKLVRVRENIGAALTAYNAGHDTGNREYAEKVMAAAERWRTE